MWGFARGRAPREEGITLLEVLIATVILIFGIYAVIRIYPPGLSIIQEGSKKLVASRVAGSLVEQMQGGRLALPEAIISPNNPFLSPKDVPNHLRQQRYILNERVQLPAPVTGGYIPYLLQHGPADPAVAVDVISGLYRKVPFAELAQDGVDRERYAVDNATGQLAFDVVPYDRVFNVRYIWMDTNGQLHPQIEPLTVPRNQQRVQVSAAGNIAFAGLVDNSESLYQVYINAGNALSPASPPNPAEFLANFDYGVLYFHPADTGKRVRVSYATAGWQILREDALITDAGGAGQVRLTFDFLDDPNNPDDPANPPIPVRVVERATGAPVPPQRYVVDYRNGILFFPATDVGKEVRVFYQTLDKWGVEWIPASAFYEPGLTLNPPPPDAYRRYAATIDPANGQTVLGFMPSEGGKAVRVDYLDANRVPINGELYSIPFAPDPNTGLCQIRLRRPIAQTNGVPHRLVVRGASLKFRILWRNEDGKLKNMDVDTYVGL